MTVHEAMKYFDSVKTEPGDAADAGKILADEVRRLSGMRRKFLVEAWEHRQVSFEVEANNEEDAKKVAEDVYHNDERLQDIMIHDDESVAYDEFRVIADLGPATGIISPQANDKRVSDLIKYDADRKKSRASIMYCLDHLMHALNNEDAILPWLSDGLPDGEYQMAKPLSDHQLKGYIDIDEGQGMVDGLVALAARILFREVFPKAYSYALNEANLHSNVYEGKVLI